ncbi:MAG: AAA family ATPase [Opitutae bacterium]
MRLISLTIKNYRIHREIEVKFSPRLQVIGGRNECGKSTIAEAIHRVLFLKSKGKTETHTKMQSNFGGEPLITLKFEQEGKTYVLTKRYLEDQMTKFSIENQHVYTDDEAEEELSKVIHTKLDVKKGEIITQWAHLWSWQDKNMDNPVSNGLYPHQDLLSEMQRIGGSAVLQSPKDQQIAKGFIRKRDQMFNTKGLQIDSLAAQALARLKEAKVKYENDKNKYEETQNILESIRIAEEKISAEKALQTKLKEDLAKRESEIQRIEVIERDILPIKSDIKNLDDEILLLKNQKNEIEDIQKSILELKNNIKGFEANLRTLREETTNRKNIHLAATQAAIKAYADRDELQKKATFVQSSIDKIELLKKEKSLNDDLKVTAEIDEKINTLNRDLARIPAITREQITALAKLTDEVSKIKASLEAMGVSVLVEKSSTQVLLDSNPLAEGKSEIIVNSTIIQIGKDTTLRISPKNGDIATQREKLTSESGKVDAEFRKLGIQTLAEAEINIGKIDGIKKEIQLLTQKRGKISTDEIKTKLKDLSNELIQYVAKYPDTKDVKIEDEAALIINKAELTTAVSDAIQNAKLKGDYNDSAKKVFDEAESNEREKLKEVSGINLEIQKEEGKMKGILLIHTDLSGLEEKISARETSKAQLELRYIMQADELKKLSPEQVRSEIKMKKVSLEKSMDALTEARAASDTNRGKVSLLAAGDPKVALESARAKLESAQTDFDRENNLAEAIRLLGDTFEETQTELNKAFTGPLLDKINDYAKIIFGQDALIDMTQNDGEFTEPVLVRPQRGQNSRTPFNQLSGGAKEQFSASIRLAMAEVLSASHGGQLPIIFDDTFSYTDQENLNKVYHMLNHAADKGIQVILFTHSPDQFKEMGADQFLIN